MESLKTILSHGKTIPTSKSSEQDKANKYGLYHTGANYRLPQKEQTYDCPKCQDREIVEIGVDSLGLSIYSDCTCKAKKSAARKLKSSGLRGNQLAYRLEDYQVNDNNQDMLEGVKRYLKAWPEKINSESESKGFCLIGNPGIGKTMLSCIIASDMLSKSVQVVFVSSADLLAELRQAQLTRDKENMEEKIETLGKVQALILDDIGKEKPTEWVQNMYYRLIDLRYRNNLLTGFNSNYYPKELAQRLGEVWDATMSRLIGLTREHFLCATDFDHRIEG